MNKLINENTAAIHRASVSKAFNAKPAPKSEAEKAAEELQKDLGKDVIVKPASKMAKGGKVSSASKRADGCAIRGKTKGRMV